MRCVPWLWHCRDRRQQKDYSKCSSHANSKIQLPHETKVKSFQPYVFGPAPAWEKPKWERHGDKNEEKER